MRLLPDRITGRHDSQVDQWEVEPVEPFLLQRQHHGPPEEHADDEAEGGSLQGD